MNKVLLILLSLTIAFSSCKKSDSENPQPEPPPPDTTGTGGGGGGGITTVPASFTQKVLLEEFTGAWCTTCPDADYKRDQVVSTYPGRIVAVAVHQTDGMSISTLYNTLFSNFNMNTPSGMINRTPSLGNVSLTASQWMTNSTSALAKTAKSGVAMTSSVNGTTANIEVHAGFKETLTGNYNLTVYLVEDSVTGSGSGFNQSNAYNTSNGSPFYGLGNPIVNYKHNRVVRKVLTSNLGDVIPVDKLVAGGEFVKTYSIDISVYNQSRLYVVGFVNKTGTTPTTHEIMNAQQAKIGVLKDWD